MVRLAHKALLASVILILSQAMQGAGTAGADCLTLANNANKFRLVATFDRDVRKVFEKAGVCAKYINIPLKRMQHNMMNGSLDGEYLRVKAYAELMKDYVIPIPTEAITLDGFLVSFKNSGFAPQTLADIRNKRIGVIHGAVWQRKAAKGAEKIYRAYKYDILAELVRRQELDAFLIERLSLQSLLTSGVFSPGDVTISPVVIKIPTYIFLHKKHKDMIPRLDKALRQVKQEGGFKFTALPR